MEKRIIETWLIHHRMNLYLLDAISDEALLCVVTPKSRTVHALFAHMHNVRLMWLKAAAPKLMEGLNKLETDAIGSKDELHSALEASGTAIAELLRQGLAEGKIKGFKPHPIAFLGYLISHESHHRGQAGWALKHGGHPLDKKTAYGIWEWGVR